MPISLLKKASGAKAFASVVGKSTISADCAEYKMIQAAVKVLFEQGFGIIHGGYAGGAMQAASDAASEYILEHGLPAERNIGIPQTQHDVHCERVAGATFTEPAEDLFFRLSAVTSGDLLLVSPVGGDGTEAEVAVVFHENVVGLYDDKKPVPMIFLETENGTQWKKLMESKCHYLATAIKDVDACPWLHFVHSIPELESLVKKLFT